MGDFIYFDEATWGTNFRLKLLYADTINGFDKWAYYRHDPQTTYAANGIQVERSTGIWTDWGNEEPNTVNNDTPTSGKIQFENQYNQVYTFTNPYPTSTTDPNAIELRQDFTITGGAWINESVVKETGGTNNTNGSNADNSGWDTTYPSPWNTLVDIYSWSIVGHHNHKIIYDPAQPTNSGQGWMYLDAINGGWTSSITNAVVKFLRNSDNWYIQWNVADTWVNEAPSSNTPSTPVEPNVLTHTNSALYGSYEWRYHSQTTAHYLYGMCHIGNDDFFDVPTSLI